MALIILQQGNQKAGMRLSGQTYIGRLPENDLVLDAHGISREHTRIVVEGDRCTVEDLGSTNGTWVNGERIAEARLLNGGDEILVGRVQLTFLDQDELPMGVRELRRRKSGRHHIAFRCPSCQEVLEAPREMAGKKGKCQNCETRFIVPLVTGGAAQPATPAPIAGDDVKSDEPERRKRPDPDRVRSEFDDDFTDVAADEQDVQFVATEDTPYDAVEQDVAFVATDDAPHNSDERDEVDLTDEAEQTVDVADPADNGDTHSMVALALPRADETPMQEPAPASPQRVDEPTFAHTDDDPAPQNEQPVLAASDDDADERQPGWDAEVDPLLTGFWLDDSDQKVDPSGAAPDDGPEERSFADLGRNLTDESAFFVHAVRDRLEPFGARDAGRGDESILPSDEPIGASAHDDTLRGLADVDADSERLCVADLPADAGGLVNNADGLALAQHEMPFDDTSMPPQAQMLDLIGHDRPVPGSDRPLDNVADADASLTRELDWWDSAAVVMRKDIRPTRSDHVAASIQRVAKQPRRRRGLVARVQRQAKSHPKPKSTTAAAALAEADVDPRPMDMLLSSAEHAESMTQSGRQLMADVRAGVEDDIYSDIVVMPESPLPMAKDDPFRRIEKKRKRKHREADIVADSRHADLLVTSDSTMSVDSQDSDVAHVTALENDVALTVDFTEAGESAPQAPAPGEPIYSYASPSAAMLDDCQTIVDSSASRTIDDARWSAPPEDPGDSPTTTLDDQPAPQRRSLISRFTSLFAAADRTVPNLDSDPDHFERYGETIASERREQLALTRPVGPAAPPVDEPAPATDANDQPTAVPENAAMTTFLHLMARYAGRGGVVVQPESRGEPVVRRHYKGEVNDSGIDATLADKSQTIEDSPPIVEPAIQREEHHEAEPGAIVEPIDSVADAPAELNAESLAVTTEAQSVPAIESDTTLDAGYVAEATASVDLDIADEAIAAPAEEPPVGTAEDEPEGQPSTVEGHGPAIDNQTPEPATANVDNSHMVEWFPEGKEQESSADNSHLIEWFAEPAPTPPPVESKDNSHMIEWFGETQSATEAPKPAAAPVPHTRCSICGTICGTHVDEEEDTITCAECGTTYHAACWQENRGCATYGCGQVNALAPDVTPRPIGPPAHIRVRQVVTHRKVDRGRPWDLIMLVTSLAAGLASLATYGVPSILVAIVSTVLRLKQKKRFSGALYVLILVVSFVAFAAGVALSMLIFRE